MRLGVHRAVEADDAADAGEEEAEAERQAREGREDAREERPAVGVVRELGVDHARSRPGRRPAASSASAPRVAADLGLVPDEAAARDRPRRGRARSRRASAARRRAPRRGRRVPAAGGSSSAAPIPPPAPRRPDRASGDGGGLQRAPSRRAERGVSDATWTGPRPVSIGMVTSSPVPSPRREPGAASPGAAAARADRGRRQPPSDGRAGTRRPHPRSSTTGSAPSSMRTSPTPPARRSFPRCRPRYRAPSSSTRVPSALPRRIQARPGSASSATLVPIAAGAADQREPRRLEPHADVAVPSIAPPPSSVHGSSSRMARATEPDARLPT